MPPCVGAGPWCWGEHSLFEALMTLSRSVVVGVVEGLLVGAEGSVGIGGGGEAIGGEGGEEGAEAAAAEGGGGRATSAGAITH